MVSQCRATNAAGGPCQAQPVRDSGYCYWHDPGSSEERQRKRAEGGANRSNARRARKNLPAELLSTAELCSWLGLTFRGVISGKVSPGVATAASTVAKTIAELSRSADLEERITALERERDLGRPA